MASPTSGAGQFKTVTVDTVAPGSGPFITEIDGVIIEYTGRTENGTVFDTTEGRGPAPFLVDAGGPRLPPGAAKDAAGRPLQDRHPGPSRLWRQPAGRAARSVPNEDLSFDVHVAAGCAATPR